MPYAAVPSPMVCLECSSEAAAKFRRWIEFPTHNVAHVFPVPPETRSALRKLHLQARLGLVIPTSVLHQSFPKPVPIWFGLKDHILGNSCFLPLLRILGPFLRKI